MNDLSTLKNKMEKPVSRVAMVLGNKGPSSLQGTSGLRGRGAVSGELESRQGGAECSRQGSCRGKSSLACV